MPLPPVDLATIAAGTGGFVIHGDEERDYTGISVASAGDINGDGFDDVVIGASLADGPGNAMPESGASYVVFGRADRSGTPVALSDIAAGTGGFVIHGRHAGDLSGFSVGSAGDLNGDGFHDLVIGGYWGDGAEPVGEQPGESYIVFGRASGFGASVDLSEVAAGTGGFVIRGQDPGDRFGFSVASAGDINGDGLDDLIVGAFFADGAADAHPLAGDSYVVFGRADDGFPACLDLAAMADGTAGFVLHGQDAMDYAGLFVASAGDMNGDGFDDILVGAPGGDGPDNARDWTGQAYLVFGSAGGFAPSMDLSAIVAAGGGVILIGENPLDEFGGSVARAGDVNGDGFQDMIVGASGGSGAYGTAFRAGNSYVVFGSADGFGTSLAMADIAAGVGGFVLYGQDSADLSGWTVATAGDINADGLDDLLIGAPEAGGADNGVFWAGETYVVFGRQDGFGASLDLSAIAAGTGGFVLYGQDAGDRSGVSVATAGDIDGDGFDDLLVGAPRGGAADNATYIAGEAYVMFGDDLTGAVTRLGGPESDTLIGGGSPDVIVGCQGNDWLFGQGGTDVLIGGAGNDVFVVPDLTFRRVLGGRGHDTLALDGAGMTVRLGAIAGSRLCGIEAIDLTGSGSNGLAVTALDVLTLSDSTNMLRVDGDIGDSVSLDPLQWIQAETDGAYTVFVSGQARLEVASSVAILCFRIGTRIMTPNGPVAVERLGEGDEVLTRGGRRRPVLWVGHRRVTCSQHPDPRAVWPVRIAAHAFGRSQPGTDLWLSPDHALFLNGALVPVKCLIDGKRIAQVSTDVVIYYHVELDRHDILLAEGLPVESYLDTGDRDSFANAGRVMRLFPMFGTSSTSSLVWEALGCAPLVVTGPAVDRARALLRRQDAGEPCGGAATGDGLWVERDRRDCRS